MGHIFVLMGKTNSYKDFVMERCTHNQSLYCTDITNIDEHLTNIVSANMEGCEFIRRTYCSIVYPVFIYTGDYQVLRDGIENIMRSGTDSYADMCSTFISECNEYSEELLNRINAVTICEGCAADAYSSLIRYIKMVLQKDSDRAGDTL